MTFVPFNPRSIELLELVLGNEFMLSRVGSRVVCEMRTASAVDVGPRAALLNILPHFPSALAVRFQMGSIQQLSRE